MKKTFDVVGALIEKDGRMLLCKRMPDDRFGSMWEFPGGKVEKNEERIDALRRELIEEIGVEVEIVDLVGTLEDEIPIMKIYVYLYNCNIMRGEPRCIECQDIRWVTLDEAQGLELAPADKKIVKYLMDKRRSG